MSSIKTLYNRLQTLITENKSGIVALCRGYETADSLEYMVYFHSLGYVKVVQDHMSCYFMASIEKKLQRELKYFSDRDDYLSLSEIGIEQEHFLDTVINSMLWDMAHEMGNIDPDDSLKDKWQIPRRIENWGAYSEFTLGLADTIEGEIDAFRTYLKNKSRISSHGKEFQVGLIHDDYASTFVLREWVWETFKDDDTGKEYQIERTRPLLQCYHNWRALYAKFRLAYYNQLHEINIAEQQKKYRLTEDPMSLPESPDQIKVMNKHELAGVVSMDDNQEQEAIIFEGQECRKVELHAYDTEYEPDSRVRISHMYFQPVADLPLRCFKEKMR